MGGDMHTSTFNQALAAEYIAGGYLERQLPRIVEIYRPRQEAMLSAMDQFFPDSFSWSRPEGGMFIWAEGPEGSDSDSMYHEAVKRNVAFVPGRHFYTEPGKGLATMRLNYTMSGEAVIRRAIETLAEVLRASA